MIKLTKDGFGYTELKEWVKALDEASADCSAESLGEWACYQLLPGLKEVLAYFDSIDVEE